MKVKVISEETLDWFLTLIKGSEKHQMQNVNIWLKKIDEHPDNEELRRYLENAEIKRDTYTHVLELANICFKR